MDVEQARQIVSRWVDTHPDRQLADTMWPPLPWELAALLPDGGTFAAVDDGEAPAITGTQGASLFQITVEVRVADCEAPLPDLTVRRSPLSGDHVAIELHQRMAWSPRLSRERSWKFDAGTALGPTTFSTEQLLREPGWDLGEPAQSEIVARAICAQVGWEVPGQARRG
jgi:hypothetical protein